MNWILYGMPKSGKTTTGKMLAKEHQLNWVDTDQIIEDIYVQKFGIKRSNREIFVHEGNNSFRELEHEAVQSLVGTKDHLISIGGGTLLDERNVTILKSLGSFLYLQMPLEILLKRVLRDPPATINPDRTIESYTAMYYERTPIFEQLADQTIGAEDGK